MTAGPVDIDLRDGIMVLTLAEKPTNALTPAVRAALLAAITAPVAGCRAIVLTGGGATFSSQMPMDADADGPALQDLCQAVAGAGVPVVAAIQGLALGPGAELALAATARLGQTGCRIGFPEVAFGLCCAGGSTRRLARLIGAEAALRLLLSGRIIPAEEARHAGLLDAISPDAPRAALTLARRLAEGGVVPRLEEAAATGLAAVAAARRAQARALPAARRIIDCVEAGYLLPPDAADRFETVARADLAASSEAAALSAAARADRRAARAPAAVARAEALPLTGLGLAGDGPDLAILARAALLQGIAVHWLHPSGSAMLDSLGLDPAKRQALRHVDDPGVIAAQTVQVHDRPALAPLRRPLDAGRAFLVLGGAEGEMGLTLAPSARACELAVVAEEAPQAIATALGALRRLQIAPLLVGRIPGIGRATLRAGDAAVGHLAATGVPLADLTAALAPFGLQPPRLALANGPRQMSGADIARRWLAAMAAEGLRLLEQGRALRPSDIDLALVAGHGFARWQGGPMHQADRRGLMVLRHDLRLWAAEDPIWSVPPLLDRLIRDGVTLAALNGV